MSDEDISSVVVKALTIEAAKNKITGGCGLDLLKINKPGTLIWTDPATGEERYTAPGEAMYSTASLFAEHFINNSGDRELL